MANGRRIRDLTVLHVVPDPELLPHGVSHSHRELVYIAGGDYRVALDGKTTSCLAGTLCFYPPETLHQPQGYYRWP